MLTLTRDASKLVMRSGADQESSRVEFASVRRTVPSRPRYAPIASADDLGGLGMASSYGSMKDVIAISTGTAFSLVLWFVKCSGFLSLWEDCSKEAGAQLGWLTT